MYKATRLDLIQLKISKDLRLGQTLREKCPYSEFFRSLFSRIRTDADRYSASLRIQSECRKIQARKKTNTDTFHAVKNFGGFLLSLLQQGMIQTKWSHLIHGIC